jgi:hypothetical protein
VSENLRNNRQEGPSYGWKSDKAAQPDYARMGALSPARIQQADLRQEKPCDFSRAMAMGSKETSTQTIRVEKGELFYHRRRR